MAALGRFISQLGEKGLPLFKILKKADQFEWSPEVERALQGLKGYLSSPPVLMAPIPEKPLLLYIAATPMVVSVILVIERNHVGDELARTPPSPKKVMPEPYQAAGADLSSKKVAPKLARAASSDLSP